MPGAGHSGQVLGIAIHCGSGIVVSGCGIPPYPNRLSDSAPHTAAAIKVWCFDPPVDSGDSGGSTNGSGLSGHLEHTLLGHTDSVNAVQLLYTAAHPVAQSSCRPLAASASNDTTIIIWDLTRAEAQRTLRGHLGAVTALTRAPTGLYSASSDGTVREWNWRTGECCRVLVESDCSLSALSLHSGTVAVGSFDGRLQLYSDEGFGSCRQMAEVVAAESEDPNEQVAVPSVLN